MSIQNIDFRPLHGFAEWVQLIHSTEDAGLAAWRCSVMFFWFPFEYGGCQL